jgi:hypothetical protein
MSGRAPSRGADPEPAAGCLYQCPGFVPTNEMRME